MNNPTPTAEEFAAKIIEETNAHHIEAEALAAMLSQHLEHFLTLDAADIVAQFDETYCGYWNTPAEFAENELYDTGYLDDLPDIIARYVDWERVWECDLRHDYYDESGHFFRCS